MCPYDSVVSDISTRFRRRAARFTASVEAVPPERWSLPAPCEGWDARDVVRHMVDSCGRFLGLIGRSLPPAPSVDDDPVGAWDSARDAVQACLDDPATATQEYEGRVKRMTFEVGVDGFLSWDTVIHTWDLARAAGLDESLDPADVRDIWATILPMDDMLRTAGVCGPKVAVSEDADDQTKLLAFLGRRA